MSAKEPTHVAASVRARLKNHATRSGAAFDLVMARYGAERFLYRLAASPYRDRFVLKGAALFMAWSLEPHRPTRDIDLLGFGPSDVSTIEGVMRAIATLPVVDDGLVFPPEAVRGRPIKIGQRYEGVRVTMLAMLERARIPIQVDVGFGDTMVPPPDEGVFQALLDLPAPVLRLYPRETVVAEKFHAVVELGSLNSRMKDFYDFWALAQRFDFEGPKLVKAMAATFQKRGTPLPVEAPPLGLTPAFADDAKLLQWVAFLRKSGLAACGLIDEVLPLAQDFLLPPARAAALGEAFDQRWAAGGPWRP